MTKVLYECPECGSETVTEAKVVLGIIYEVERCNGLVDVGPNRPLEACKWSQELKMISNGIEKR